MATINFLGVEYPYADLSDITIGEGILLKEYSDLNIDQVEDAGFHAGVIAAIIHISVLRKNPDFPPKTLREKILKLPMAQLEQVFQDISVEKEDEERPPGSASPSGSPPATSSENETGTSEPSTGSSGSNGSGNSDSVQKPTGSHSSEPTSASDQVT